MHEIFFFKLYSKHDNIVLNQGTELLPLQTSWSLIKYGDSFMLCRPAIGLMYNLNKTILQMLLGHFVDNVYDLSLYDALQHHPLKFC